MQLMYYSLRVIPSLEAVLSLFRQIMLEKRCIHDKHEGYIRGKSTDHNK
jgi:hypothetical protein